MLLRSASRVLSTSHKATTTILSSQSTCFRTISGSCTFRSDDDGKEDEAPPKFTISSKGKQEDPNEIYPYQIVPNMAQEAYEGLMGPNMEGPIAVSDQYSLDFFDSDDEEVFSEDDGTGDGEEGPPDDFLDQEIDEDLIQLPAVGSRAPLPRRRKIDSFGRAYGSGGRKEASARVWVKKGSGLMYVNNKPAHEYFSRWDHRQQIIWPFSVVEMQGEWDVWCTVKGGGVSGQAGAVRHGIANALQAYDPYLRPVLKRVGLLKRDMRKVERKKPGQPKARKKKTWVRR